MKNQIIKYFLFVLLTTNLAFGQHSEKFVKLIQKADSLYSIKDFDNGAKCYSLAFKLYNWKIIFPNFRYNAACLYALSNQQKKSFNELFLLAKKLNFCNYQQLLDDTDLNSLHQTKEWKKIIEIVKRNKEESNLKLNKTLITDLDSIYNDDQNYRLKSEEIEKKYGYNSNELKKIVKEINKKDSINQIKILKIFDKYGWPDPSTIGENGSGTIFLVIQHSSKEMRLKFLPIMRKAVKKGNAQGSDLALLEDRTAIDQGRKQVYGSQLSFDQEKKEIFFDINSIQNLKKINKKRHKLGMQPISEYLKHFNIEWANDKERLYPNKK